MVTSSPAGARAASAGVSSTQRPSPACLWNPSLVRTCSETWSTRKLRVALTPARLLLPSAAGSKSTEHLDQSPVATSFIGAVNSVPAGYARPPGARGGAHSERNSSVASSPNVPSVTSFGMSSLMKGVASSGAALDMSGERYHCSDL